jgi:hypothetical protein
MPNPVAPAKTPPTLTPLDSLHGRDAPRDEPERPYNPGAAQKILQAFHPGEKTTGSGSPMPGRSNAPAILIVVDKGEGIVDAFWFYFYSFNLGNEVFRVRFGNHVGDWEHSLVRFHNGKPKAVYMSEHSSGDAYTYEAVEKIGLRVSPVQFLDLQNEGLSYHLIHGQF